MHVYESRAELIGHTPLMRLSRFGARMNAGRAVLLAKLEAFNPGGSAKDRVAERMLQSAIQSGLLREGGTVIEPTSGNTGIGLAASAAARGLNAILVMPDTMSVERRKLLAAFGARIVLTDGALGMRGAIEKAEALHAEIPGSLIAGQFVNPANPEAHEVATGPEIWDDTDGQVDLFVAGVGTGGTITGTGRFLKSRKPETRIIAVEPAASPVLSGGKPGPHGLQGIGAGFVPDVLDMRVVDEVLRVTDAEAFAAARLLARTEGITAGISGGAALHAACVLASRPENKGRTIVVLLPDSGDRYLSTSLYE